VDYLEFRVGNERASDLQLQGQLQINEFCNLLGNNIMEKNAGATCCPALHGRFVTIQKVNTGNGNWQMGMQGIVVIIMNT